MGGGKERKKEEKGSEGGLQRRGRKGKKVVESDER